VKDLMASIAGRENDSATKVFKNVQMMRSMTASQLLTAMDQGIGRALNAGCESCHQLNNFASDSVARKGRARIMLNMVNTINTDPKLLNALGPGRGGGPRSISCVTCHRGGQAGRQDIIP
jgi:photosynthetic reaction center cytochrome c subunit